MSRISNERNLKILQELVSKPGNDVCADCKSRAPRWASYNLGIFLCVSCASIHRKLGVHISKVKSLTLDAWTKENVEAMQKVGNVKSNAYFNPDEVRHPPPTNMVDSERDSELEKFIRAKYEFKRFVNPKSTACLASGSVSGTSSAPSISASSGVTAAQREQQPRKASAPINDSDSLVPPPTPPKLHTSRSNPNFSQSQPQPQTPAPPSKPSYTAPTPVTPAAPAGGVWNDLISLQGPSQSSSLPLQYAAHPQPQLSVSLPTGPAGFGGMAGPYTGASQGIPLSNTYTGMPFNSSPVSQTGGHGSMGSMAPMGSMAQMGPVGSMGSISSMSSLGSMPTGMNNINPYQQQQIQFGVPLQAGIGNGINMGMPISQPASLSFGQQQTLGSGLQPPQGVPQHAHSAPIMGHHQQMMTPFGGSPQSYGQNNVGSQFGSTTSGGFFQPGQQQPMYPGSGGGAFGPM